MTWYSQAGQDEWVAEMTSGKRGGFFVDLGAYDGVQTSNTYALEQTFGWTGICVEANVDYYNDLVRNRPDTTSINVAVAGSLRELHFSGQLETSDPNAPVVMGRPLSDILDQFSAPPIIDYLSIDVEGMEMEVLSAFDFSSRQINLMTVEHNLYLDGPENKNKLFELLTANGFERVVEDAPCLDLTPAFFMQPYEDWYRNSAFLRA